MRSNLGYGLVSLAILGLAAAPAALAVPTQAEVNKARAACSAQKQRVKQLEAANTGDPAVSGAREQWESACAKANALMDARDGRSAPEPAAAPAALPEPPMAPAPAEEASPAEEDVPPADEAPDAPQPAPLDIS